MKPSRLPDKISQKLFMQKKRLLQRLRPHANQKKILFIVGCQRSGTSLMDRIFKNDLRTKTYSEFSELSSEDDYNLKLNPLPSVAKDIYKERAPFVVLKPLVESQNTVALLNYFEDSQALWMYRHYKDVAASNLKHFGIENGINDIKPIVENASGNWRSEKVSESVRSTIRSHFTETMNPYDAAVLFWYARNSFYFELGLEKRSDVLICKYEDLVTLPEQVIKTIYDDLGQPYPGSSIHKEIHATSLKRGADIDLSPQVEQLANDLWANLNESYQTKTHRDHS